MPPLDENQYRLWKAQLIPLIYDWFANHNLTWPTQSCRWGPKQGENAFKTSHRIYISEQTDNSEPQKLVVATVDVCKPRVASAETVGAWNEFSKCPYVKEHMLLFHPGEVNKIRELPQHPHIICTHTDAPEVYVWNLEKQPGRLRSEYVKDKKGAPASVADLMLTGHTETAQFPLATCSVRPCVASGGQDKQVLTWDLQDSMETLLAGSGGSAGAKKAPTLDARSTFTGHEDTVEDVVFRPGSCEELASVGDDHQMLFWDSRTGSSPTLKVAKAHSEHDIQCVDWSALTPHQLATGAADGSLKVWDMRKLGSAKDAIFTFNNHEQGILRVEWSPHTQNVLASGSEDHMLLVWQLDKVAEPTGLPEPKRVKGAAPPPPQLLFTHAGHRIGRVVDFQWHPSDPWTFLSVSDDTVEDEEEEEGGGGTLQMWRINDMITRPLQEVTAELEQYKDAILHGIKAPAVKREAKTPPASAEAKPAKSPRPPKETTSAGATPAVAEATPTTAEPAAAKPMSAEPAAAAPISAEPAAPEVQRPAATEEEASAAAFQVAGVAAAGEEAAPVAPVSAAPEEAMEEEAPSAALAAPADISGDAEMASVPAPDVAVQESAAAVCDDVGVAEAVEQATAAAAPEEMAPGAADEQAMEMDQALELASVDLEVKGDDRDAMEAVAAVQAMEAE